MHSFGSYSKYYDLLYYDKDYEQECDFLEKVFQTFSSLPIKTILECGCGSGGHAIPLARRGYEVTGFDASATMLETARHKLQQSGLRVDLHHADLRSFQLGRQFDAAISMFAVMNYLTTTEDIKRALANIRAHLKPGSLFCFDFWNGLTVLRILPSVRVKVVEKDGVKVIRTVEPELDAFNHLCKNHYRMMVIEGDRVADTVEETHIVRYFFPQEIAHHLEDAGFEVLAMCPFLDLEGKVDENVWNIAAIARAV